MKDKNKKLMIVVGVLLLVIGVSFAYFVSTVLIGGTGARTKLNTASINGATIEVKGTLSFNDLDIYPGHQTISGIELIATGDGEFVPYNLVWNGTNSLNTPLNFTVYKSESKIEVSATCNKTTKIENGAQILAEECTITNKESLGSPIYNGTINKDSSKVALSSAEFITATSEGNKVYYYVILEYPNLDEEQNIDIGGTFSGEVTVEENNSSADITIASIYIEDNDNYKEVERIPEGRYVLNEEKSTCTNNAKPIWNEETQSIQVNSLTTSGTECNIYYDIDTRISISDIISANNPKTETPNFANVATSDEGVYAVEDGMYGGTSYYWRGAATTNYVKFAGFCWRIVRINGDKTMRLIYDGTTCHANGTNDANSIAKISQKYNPSYDRSEYVGWTYSTGSQRTTGGSSSNIKTQTDSWFTSNIMGTNAEKVADGKFCNDRDVQSGYSWSSQPTSTFYYAARGRLDSAKIPTLECPSGDVYAMKAGTITADEVAYAGGVNGQANQSYYLYNGQYYWTMSPYYWYYSSSSNRLAYVFLVTTSGALSNTIVRGTYGLRPVINLNANTQFQAGGNGTQSNPYIVS